MYYYPYLFFKSVEDVLQASSTKVSIHLHNTNQNVLDVGIRSPSQYSENSLRQKTSAFVRALSVSYAGGSGVIQVTSRHNPSYTRVLVCTVYRNVYNTPWIISVFSGKDLVNKPVSQSASI